jgi:hypothetical protein
MTREEFKRRHEPRWQRLEELLDGLDSATVRVGSAQWRQLDSQDLAEFDRLYRLICKHLALARLRLYGNDLVDRLNSLALRAHHHFYGARRGYWRRAFQFIAADFPSLVRRKWRVVALASFLFAGPLIAIVAAITADPDLVHAVLPPEQVRNMEEMYDPGSDYRRGHARRRRLGLLPGAQRSGDRRGGRPPGAQRLLLDVPLVRRRPLRLRADRHRDRGCGRHQRRLVVRRAGVAHPGRLPAPRRAGERLAGAGSGRDAGGGRRA